MFGIEYVIFVIIVQMLIGTCQGRFGSNAVAIPALNEVTSDQGLAVAESKQAWKKTTFMQSFLTQSFDQSTQYPLPKVSHLQYCRCPPCPSHNHIPTRSLHVDHDQHSPVHTILLKVRLVPTLPPFTCIQKHHQPWPYRSLVMAHPLSATRRRQYRNHK